MCWPRLFAGLCVGAACLPVHAEPTRVGLIDSDRIPEASGLARSRRTDRLWVINDGGSPPVLHAVGVDGALHGEVAVDGVQNHDWEDLASFETNGNVYLVIADVGDNGAVRPSVSLHIVPEPDPDSTATVTPERTIHFRYPDGPRDAESIAVDASTELVYVLTKRDVPAKLYTVPLHPIGTDPVLARWMSDLESLPQPTARDVRIAPRLLDWFWQPTAMDFAADGTRATVLTYRGTYTYRRDAEESWAEALRRTPATNALPGVIGPEALAIVGDVAYVTVEARRPPLYRVLLANPR